MERIANKNIKTSIFRIQDYNSIMCGYFCILFIEYMLNDKTLTDFTNLFSPWNFEKNDEIIKRYFQLFFYKNDGNNKFRMQNIPRRSKQL